MPISHPYRTIFVHIPKTGGTSIEVALGMFYSWKEENTDALFGLIQSPQLCAKGWMTRYLQHLGWDEISQLVPAEQRLGYRSFSWVRNPWERMVSTYANKDPNMLEHAQMQGLQLAGLSFNDFVDATLDLPHIHLRPQHEFILDSENKALVDYIGRFENFDIDFANLCQKYGIKAELPHKNKSTHKDYRSYYNDHTRQLISTKYARDIDIFGYSF